MPLVAWIVLVVGVVVGVHLRLASVADEALFGDEIHAAPIVLRGYETVLTTFDRFGSHIGFPLLQRVSLDLLGTSLWAYRAPAMAAGILALLLMFPIARVLVGTTSAWVATLTLAVLPIHVYYSRFARPYAVVVLLAIVFVYCLVKALPPTSARRGPWIVTGAIVGGLMPYVHLSSCGLLAGIGVASTCQAFIARKRLRDTLVPIGMFLAVGAIVVALYLPAWDSSKLFRARLEGLDSPAPNPVGTLILLGGSAGAAFVLFALSVPGLAGTLLTDSKRGLLLFGAIFGPPIVLIASSPPGPTNWNVAYPHARYLITIVPFILMLASWSLQRALRSIPFMRERPTIVYGVLLLLVALFGFSGPLWGTGLRKVQFSNTNLALYDIAALNAPFEGTPEFYRQLASRPDEVTLIECPLTTYGSNLLYRNYALQHGQRTLVGMVGRHERLVKLAEGRGRLDLLEGRPNALFLSGPYVWVKDPYLWGSGLADYLVLHTVLWNESRDFTEAAASLWNEDASWSERQLEPVLTPARSDPVKKLARELERAHGAPVFQDDFIKVWDLRVSNAGAGAPEPAAEESRPRSRRRRR